MTWVIKAGDEDDDVDLGNPEYLQEWKYSAHNEPKDFLWVDKKNLAFRFDDRNAASRICSHVLDYTENVRVVALVKKTFFSVEQSTELAKEFLEHALKRKFMTTEAPDAFRYHLALMLKHGRIV